MFQPLRWRSADRLCPRRNRPITCAYLCDVYVLETYQGRGLGTWLIETVCSHPDLQIVRRFSLVTRDAHRLYEKFGFTPIADPSRHMEIRRPEIYKTLAAIETDRPATRRPFVRPAKATIVVRGIRPRSQSTAGARRALCETSRRRRSRPRALDLGCGPAGMHCGWRIAATKSPQSFFRGHARRRAREKAGSKRIRFVVHDLHHPLPFE